VVDAVVFAEEICVFWLSKGCVEIIVDLRGVLAALPNIVSLALRDRLDY
jgi:hypothetical protein